MHQAVIPIFSKRTNRISFPGFVIYALLAFMVVTSCHYQKTVEAHEHQHEQKEEKAMNHANHRNHRRHLVGGYSRTSDMKKKNEAISKAVDFVVQEMIKGQGPTVSFSSQLRQYELSEGENENVRWNAVPLEVSQQVVAGMNFKMKIGIFIEKSTHDGDGDDRSDSNAHTKAEHEHCLGGVSATVFRDLKGEYSVTQWGKEIGCDQVVTLLNENEDEE